MNNQQAINLLKDLEQCLDDYFELNDEGKTAFGMAITALDLFGNSEQLPSAQPEHLVKESGNLVKGLVNDCISRQDAIDALEREKTYSAAYKYGYTQTDYFKQYNMGLTDGIKALNKLPSAQPEHTETHSCDYQRTETHESCTDCPLYDHDRHNCPRFNRVIPATIEAAKPRWIPCEECEKRCEKWENSKT